MIITLIKKQVGHEVIKEFENKHGSIKELEKLYKDTGPPLFIVDYEN
jgi:hypothetical protein